MFLLFTTQACPNCPRAKELIDEKKPETTLIDASTPEGLDRARKYNIAQVPSLVEIDDAEELLHQFSGLDAIANELG